MANKFPSRGDFEFPSGIFDEHEWIVDEFIDGETGRNCIIKYPPKPTQCDNCKLDPSTGRSSNIYNGTGPISFTNHTTCPRCGGLGRLEVAATETIRMRVYWDPRSWIDIGLSLKAPEAACMTIGYMSDLPKLEKMTSILLENDVSGVRRYEMQRAGIAVPHGFQRRYFIQYFEKAAPGE